MQHRTLAELLLPLLVAGCGPGPLEDTATDDAALRGRHSPRVARFVTRNLYVGANVDLVIAALASPDPSDDAPALAAAVQTFAATDVQTRLAAVAREIDVAGADVVGLQEAFLVDIRIPGIAEVQADFLDILLTQLRARGLVYDVVVAQETTDAVLPGVRLLDRDAILVRRGAARVLETSAALFSVNEGDPGSGFEVVRGWTSALLSLRGRTVQVIDTHLAAGPDPRVAALRTLQAAELVEIARTDVPVVLLGDLNDELGSGMHTTLTRAGFTDVWGALRPGAAGLTCCHADDLSNPRASFYERIDYVMARGFDRRRAPVRGFVWRLGLRPFERVDGPTYRLWPSDHAGLWATLVLP